MVDQNDEHVLVKYVTTDRICLIEKFSKLNNLKLLAAKNLEIIKNNFNDLKNINVYCNQLSSDLEKELFILLFDIVNISDIIRHRLYIVYCDIINKSCRILNTKED